MSCERPHLAHRVLRPGACPPRFASRFAFAFAFAPAAGLGLGLALACAGAAAAPPRADEYAYRVEPGDTLIGLQQRLLRPGAHWRSVQRLNRIDNPRRLRPGATLRIPLALLREEPASAEVLHVHGSVWLERAGEPRQPLAAAARLRSGDRIVSDKQSSASLRYVDGSRSLVGPESTLRLDRLARIGPDGPASSALRLDAGQLDTRVVPALPAPRFELQTPLVNLGVRGTDFRARATADAAQAEVLQGRVAVGPHALDGGYGTHATAAAGVAPPRVLLPAPDLASLAGHVAERLPLQLRLRERPAGPRFRAQVLDPGPPERLLLDELFDSEQLAFAASPSDGRYELRVRSSDADGVEGHDARIAFVLKARPEPPLLMEPRGGASLTEPAVTLAWTAHPEAVRYRVQVAGDAAFATLQADRDDVAGTRTSLTLPRGRWHWRVASVRAGDDAGPFGDALAFEREDAPPAPLPPRDAKDGVMLAWSAAATPGGRYQVQVARDAAFEGVVLDRTLEATEVLLPAPEPGAYHVRVRAIGADGRSAGFGSAQRFEVPRSRLWLLLLWPLLLLL